MGGGAMAYDPRTYEPMKQWDMTRWNASRGLVGTKWGTREQAKNEEGTNEEGTNARATLRHHYIPASYPGRLRYPVTLELRYPNPTSYATPQAEH